MVTMIITFFQSRLTRNVFSLYLVQGLQYLLPLITLPWLVRSLGTDGYGWISIAGAFGGYLQVLCDYGFQLSASRNIAINKTDSTRISRLFSAVLAAKILLASMGSMIALGILLAVPGYRDHALYLAIGAFGALAGSFLPAWLFQGMESMGSMSLISGVGRAIQLCLLLLLVHDRSHVARTLWINSLSSFACTAATLVLAHRRFGLRLSMPAPSEVWTVLKDGFEIFLSQAGTLLFANTNIMMLSAFADPIAVGRYAIAEKIVRVGIQVGGPISTAIYPRTALLLSASRAEAFRFLRKALAWGSVGFVIVSLGTAIGADFAVRLICGHPQPEILPLVWILCPLPLTVFVDNIFGTQVLLNAGHRKLFMSVPLSAGVLAIGLQFLLIPRLGANGASLSFLISECWILSLFAWFAWKKTGFPSIPRSTEAP
jgi:polysaccharide transporter, PST family